MLLVKSKVLRQVAGLLETLCFLSIKLLLKNPGALRLFPGVMFRNYMSLARSGQWSSRSIDELVPLKGGMRVTLEVLAGEGIATPCDELVYLALLTRHLDPKHIFEIGTFRGRTALNFALNCSPGAMVHTLDLPLDGAVGPAHAADRNIVQRRVTGADYRDKDGAERIEQLYGDSTRFDFAPYHARMDMVFVDGAHHYDAVKSDTEQALKMVRPGGYIVWHDFANYGDYNDVTRAVLDLLPAGEVIQIGSSQLALYVKR